MKKVKELKVGDMVWLVSPYIGYQYGFKVTNIKKKGTLAEVTILESYYKMETERKCYGHVSSSFLTWNGGRRNETVLVVDFNYNKELEKRYTDSQKERNVGRAALKLYDLLTRREDTLL